MEKTEGVREYLEGQIKTEMAELDRWLKQRAEADDHIAELQKKLSLLGSMAAYVRGPEGEEPAPAIGPSSGEGPYAGLSIGDGTFAVLRKAGRPLHVTAIWEELQRGGKQLKAPKPTVSITGALLRDERFANIGSNTFTLKGGESAG